MKEQYEGMEIDVQSLPEEDVITTSTPAPVIFEHDNFFWNFFNFE